MKNNAKIRRQRVATPVVWCPRCGEAVNIHNLPRHPEDKAGSAYPLRKRKRDWLRSHGCRA